MTSTPYESAAYWLEKSRRLLGWNLIRDALAAYAHSESTRELCATLEPAESREDAQTLSLETEEMHALLESAEGFPIAPFENMERLLEEITDQAFIEPEQCLNVKKFLTTVGSVKRRVDKRERAPFLKVYAERLDSLGAVFSELNRCIGDDGEIRDDASPELKQAIRDAQQARQKLEDSIRKMMASATLKDALQDDYFTEREGRLVFPVRTDRRTKVQGIVHDSSASGQTVYMEPSTLVPLNNQMKIARLTIEREKARILQALASLILQQHGTMMANLDALIHLDQIHSRARLGRVMNATPCKLNDNGPMHLLQARNPELLLNRSPVVANDICWDDTVGTLIISGPNTGGKTVTLKTVGLFSLMARAGLRLPVAENSEMPFFSQVFADIGDDQNIQENLSTFSGHLKKIIYILEQASPEALVLLDELGIATDPLEGAALAESILLELKDKGATTLVSTHYLELKMMAQTQAGFLNACAEFNPETLAPTYRLLFGTPGQSAALDTATRLGLPEAIIRKARLIYERGDNRADALLQTLTQQRLELEKKEALLREELEKAQRLAEEQRQSAERLKEQESEFKKNKAKRLQALIREAKSQIRQWMLEAKGNRTAPNLKKIEKKIHELGRVPAAPAEAPAGWDRPANTLKQGDSVLIKSYGKTGVLLDSPQEKKKVRVQIGNMVSVVESAHLLGSNTHRAAQVSQAESSVKVHAETFGQATTTCDLRGMESDEALSTLETFISRAIVKKTGRLTIIHGHGRGTIKNLVRDYLSETGICKNFVPGGRWEGGDGVTIVETE
ncbi:MAG: endonuclease MutS2 [Candidatus Nitrohelix vancouverensis]|uniref:Endonuclease MutS2 n=1 Tax=Candidatus Nitrohelix vancouverensis TaxID=2705534 RepID=A0A7T0C4P9_9BACT|nr:MAG: endonuclease MutS2 [Candidatus Nitrohelix vancouverensis]